MVAGLAGLGAHEAVCLGPEVLEARHEPSWHCNVWS